MCKVTMQTRSKTKRSKQSREEDTHGSSGRVEMDHGLWSKLPVELLEQALLFLPVPVLCRFSIVCKRWNNLICSPEFGNLCVLNASKSANEGAFVVVQPGIYPGILYPEDPLLRWSILDLNEKRWYKSKYELPNLRHNISAMDGGLVCGIVESFAEEQRRASNPNVETKGDRTLVMFNLFGGAIKVLPNPPLNDVNLHFLKLELMVENTSNTFKIIVINFQFAVYGSRVVSIYESSTGQWRNPPNTPPNWVNRGHCFASSAIFQGLLFFLWKDQNDVSRLCSLNFLDNSWEDSGVQFLHGHGIDHDLVVSDNRWFLINYSFDWSGWVLNMSEIVLADKECRTVVCIKGSEVERNFDYSSNNDFRARVFVSNNSILLMSQITGKVIVYNLTTRQWELLPLNPLEYPKYRKLGTRMNYLRLPDTPW